jgi:hypothetical protein
LAVFLKFSFVGIGKSETIILTSHPTRSIACQIQTVSKLLEVAVFRTPTEEKPKCILEILLPRDSLECLKGNLINVQGITLK